MTKPYTLTWLFTARTLGRQVFEQTLQDRSTRYLSIWLSEVSEGGFVSVVEPHMPEYAGVLAEIDAGATEIVWDGRRCYWHTKNAWADVADYAAHGQLGELHLTQVANPEHTVSLYLHPERMGMDGLAPGDMLINAPGLAVPVHVPFPLPHVDRMRLRAVCNREVTAQGFPPEMVVVDVAYGIGWQVTVDGREVSQVLRMR